MAGGETRMAKWIMVIVISQCDTKKEFFIKDELQKRRSARESFKELLPVGLKVSRHWGLWVCRP